MNCSTWNIETKAKNGKKLRSFKMLNSATVAGRPEAIANVSFFKMFYTKICQKKLNSAIDVGRPDT
jgi:hypothetical protein